jgi:hypothetical protein
LFRLPNLDTLILTTDFYVWYGAHGGCDRSAGDAYSSMSPDPISDVFRGRYVYAQSLICISYRTYEIDYCSLFLSFLLFSFPSCPETLVTQFNYLSLSFLFFFSLYLDLNYPSPLWSVCNFSIQGVCCFQSSPTNRHDTYVLVF